MRNGLALALGACVALLSPVPGTAQDYTGTYTVANQQGGTVTLALQQGAGGALTGSMTGNGTQFRVEGMVEEGVAMGAITSGDGGVYFEASLEGNALTLILIEVGAGNAPDYSKTRTLLLQRTGSGAPAPGAGGANPLGAGGNPLGGGNDPFTGTFAGDGLTLTLSGSTGSYRGTLGFQGTDYPAEARAQGSRLDGSFTAGGQAYPFSAVLQGNNLVLESAGSRYALSRSGPPPTPNPLAAPGAAVQPSGGTGLTGEWSCQTAEGPARLTFLSDRELAFNGERTPYQLSADAIQIPGDWGPAVYRYQLDGDQLSVTDPAGGTMRCQRQANRAGGEATGSGMEVMLQGPRCAYSSSPDGGFSSLYKLYFDGQGRFTSGSESSYSGDPGSAYGATNDANAGVYRVAGLRKGSEIHMRFPDGSTAVAYVYFTDDATGKILEFRLNGRHYAPALCQ
jgi:hypothetical protein